VVDVEVLCTEAFSALVSLGGVISGVLFGTTSLTLLPPPQAPRLMAHNSTRLAASATRAGEGCAGRMGEILIKRGASSAPVALNQPSLM